MHKKYGAEHGWIHVAHSIFDFSIYQLIAFLAKPNNCLCLGF
jgi:hypothetical protein